MTHLNCPGCGQSLEFSGPQPRFCSFCGKPLGATQPVKVRTEQPEAVTAPLPTPSDAETVPPTMAAPAAGADIGETVGSYRLVRPLGGGGMGVVYEAVDQHSGQHVALKLVNAEHAGSNEALVRFRQEGALASQLAHPRCVFVMAADEDRGRPYIVMELMTGSTLADLVKEQGPLPVEQALHKILDVIAGLREAHALGLVHRDVKPSNCFLETNGRVKIGDFGLAKSLVQEAHLTRTGSFLGTPLFAAPEQIKMEAVDAQSDLYAVAATLYFLLTGRAPFQTGDITATMARIVSDDPPSMRTCRPDLPKGLDRVVLRGLERDRKRRWRNLDEFQRALLPFLPAEPSVGGVGLRLGAYLLDATLLFLISLGMGLLVPVLALFMGLPVSAQAAALANLLLEACLYIGYFGVLEGLWGCSLGKRAARLRVAALSTTQRIGVRRALLRAGILYFLRDLVVIASQIIAIVLFPEAPPETIPPLVSAILIITVVWFCLSVGLVACTMRKRNGYRALHEFLSGTRTIQLRWPRKRRTLDAQILTLEIMRPEGLPERVGPYRIVGALRWAAAEKTLLGEDLQLTRKVWIWLRPATNPPLSESQRAAGRTTRVRWVASGDLADDRWDAFLEPSGCPLTEYVAENGRLSWPELRPILEDLSDELQAACAEGSLPWSLTPCQVWIGGGGHARLLDAPLTPGISADSKSDSEPKADGMEPADDQTRALAFLARIATLVLEGTSRPASASPATVRAPLPLHAAELLNRLPQLRPEPRESSRIGAPTVCDSVETFRADLLATQADALEVTRWARTMHIVGHAFYAGLGLLGLSWLFVAILVVVSGGMTNSGVVKSSNDELWLPLIIGLSVSVFLFFLPAYLTRGGLSFHRAGIAIVQADGRRASRLRCLGRALLSWTFIGVIGGLVYFAVSFRELEHWQEIAILCVAGILFVGYIFLMIRHPGRAPHDYLMGTFLVPR